MAMQGKAKNESFWQKEIESLEMDMAEIQDVLPLLREKQSVMIWGGPGIGKTMVVESLAKVLGGVCRTIVTSTYEPTDIGGVPFPVHTKEGSIQYVRYLVAKWAYEATVESECEGPMILFFDDLSTAHEQVQAACYRLFLDREVGDIKIRDNVRIIAAGNRPEDNAATHNMPTPLGNRMLHIYAKSSPDSWVNWAVNEGGVYPWIIAYIRTHTHMLCRFDPDSSEKAFATPRSLVMLSNLLYDLDKAGRNNNQHVGMRFKLTAGLVGRGWAVEFFQFVKIAEKAISPERIVKDPQTAPIPDDLSLAHVTVASCERYLKDHPSDWNPILQYALRIEPELGIILGFLVSELVLDVLPEKDRMKGATDKFFKEMSVKWGDFFNK